MESTQGSIDTVPSFESRGFDVKLVNAHYKTVPGAKQILDCQWLQSIVMVYYRFIPSR